MHRWYHWPPPLTSKEHKEAKVLVWHIIFLRCYIDPLQIKVIFGRNSKRGVELLSYLEYCSFESCLLKSRAFPYKAHMGPRNMDSMAFALSSSFTQCWPPRHNIPGVFQQSMPIMPEDKVPSLTLYMCSFQGQLTAVISCLFLLQWDSS